MTVDRRLIYPMAIWVFPDGRVSRREFLDGAQKFAVGGLTATALFEMLKPNYAWAIQVPKDDARIKAEFATVPSPEGTGSIKGYLVRPANAAGKVPAVLVIHENRGLNPYVEDVARRLAIAGYMALAPDGLTSVGDILAMTRRDWSSSARWMPRR